ncbi:vWA domain-containing protein [Neisseria shayeganii]|uniref:von Willebrand factor type A domain protein n=1 Tax=Neisseria shayeganii 871 TaxID=1032488 RepID=G4CKP6_9NEIS|nr:von Willebrand factor type A domain protein [Neisseria shayeganii 871]
MLWQHSVSRAAVAAALAMCTQAAWADSVHQVCQRYLQSEPEERLVSAPPSAAAIRHIEVAQVRSALRTAEKMMPAASPAAIAPEAAPMPRQNTERYGHQAANPVHSTAEQAVSTFSIDVDTGSYANVRRFLSRENRLPPADAVRIEELINYFDYGYAPPRDGKPFAVHTEVADSPFREQAKLLRIGIQAKEMSTAALPPANLVFLVDVSGSMMSRDKLPLVKYTLCTLAHQTRAQDRVTLITYADGNRVVLPATPGNQRQKILNALDGLKAGGATAGENAMQQAYREAQRGHVRHGINRILLATDGDFNVGITNFETLKSMVAEKRRSGVSLTTLGFGTGNYNEHLMEQLADAGDGNYSYIDGPEEARKVLQRQLSSTLATVAQDVKVQVEFNPATVKEYRLIGYENRMLAREDFNNDQVDAGDIGAGHNVTALYEIIPVGAEGWLPASRYQNAPAAEGNPSEYAFIRLRYKLPGQSNSLLIHQPVAVGSVPLARSSNATRQAAAAAAYGELLRGGKYSGATGWPQTLSLAKSAQSPDRYGLRRQFVGLIEKAQSLSSRRPQE